MKQSKNQNLFLMPGLEICSICRFASIIFLLVCLIVAFPGCAPVFSELQSAKLVGPGNLEVTPSFSSVSFSSEGESGHVQNHYGIQAGFGVNKQMDFRLRYERVNVDMEEMYGYESFGVNVLGFGPKFSLVKDMLAAYIPIGFAFGEDIDVSETWQIHPTLLITLPISKYIEFNPSAKVLVPLKGEQDTLVAFNLATAISANLEKWAIRPEIGFLYNPGESGHFMHFSIGFTYFIK